MWKLFWWLASPVWLYVRYSPTNKGKGFLVHKILIPIIPKRGNFEASILGKTKIKLGYAGALGRWMMIDGAFEKEEIKFIIKKLSKGDIAYDIGANVGYFSVVMSTIVGISGKVFSFEPMPNNLKKLKSNIALNNANNITIKEVALSNTTGTLQMYSPVDDLAFASIYDSDSTVSEKENLVNVTTDTLDNIWRDSGKPSVSIIKLDVEGAETSVLNGAKKCIQECRPVILLEANNKGELNKIIEIMRPLNYIYSQPAGFKKWNWVFHYTEVKG